MSQILLDPSSIAVAIGDPVEVVPGQPGLVRRASGLALIASTPADPGQPVSVVEGSWLGTLQLRLAHLSAQVHALSAALTGFQEALTGDAVAPAPVSTVGRVLRLAGGEQGVRIADAEALAWRGDLTIVVAARLDAPSATTLFQLGRDGAVVFGRTADGQLSLRTLNPQRAERRFHSLDATATASWCWYSLVLDRARGDVVLAQDARVLTLVSGPPIGVGSPFRQPTGPVWLGRGERGDGLVGELGEVQVWGRVVAHHDVVSASGLPSGAAPPQGLLGWWRLNDGFGARASDASGHGAVGEIIGGSWIEREAVTTTTTTTPEPTTTTPQPTTTTTTPEPTTTTPEPTTTTPVPTRRWPCLVFPTGAMVDFGVPEPIKLTGDLSVELWVRLDALPTGTGRAALYARGTTTAGVLWVESTGKLLFQGGFKSGSSTLTRKIASTTALSTGTWTHVALIRDMTQTRLRLVVNGVVDAEVSLDLSIASAGTASNTYLGQSASNKDLLQGALAEVRVWRVARTVDEVAASMRSRLLGDETGLVANWRLDEGSGSVIADRSASTITGRASATTWGETDEVAGLRERL